MVRPTRMLSSLVIVIVLSLATGLSLLPSVATVLPVLATPTPIKPTLPRDDKGTLQKTDVASFAPDELIVRFKPATSEQTVTEVFDRLGVNVIRQLLLPRYYLVSVPLGKDIASVSSLLSSEATVELVEANAYAYAHEVPNDPLYKFQWHFPLIQTEKAWDISRGAGVIVAVIDTGVAYEDYGIYRRAPELASALFVTGYDFENDDAHPNDDNRHGTHVAGTIAQSTNNGIGVAGIAYEAKVMPIKVLDSEGTGTYANVADGVVWAADHGARVINMSLGGTSPSTLMESAVNYAYQRGVTVVASAGNNATDFVSYPAAYEKVIAVGAISCGETRAFYSSFGSALDLVAPGGDTLADQNGDGYRDGVLQQTFSSSDPTRFDYYTFMGTSMSAPHVSGVAALLVSAGATSPVQVRTALESTAKDLGTPGWDKYYGHGLVQAYSALRSIPLAMSGFPPQRYIAESSTMQALILANLRPRAYIPQVRRNFLPCY